MSLTSSHYWIFEEEELENKKIRRRQRQYRTCLYKWIFVFIFSYQHSPEQVSTSKVGPFFHHFIAFWLLCWTLHHAVANPYHEEPRIFLMEVHFRFDFLGVLEGLVSVMDLGQKLENLEIGFRFRRRRRRWRWINCPFLAATAAGSDFRRGGSRRDSGEIHAMVRVHTWSFKFCWIVCVWACLIPSPIQYSLTLIFQLHSLANKRICSTLGFGNWSQCVWTLSCPLLPAYT